MSSDDTSAPAGAGALQSVDRTGPSAEELDALALELATLEEEIARRETALATARGDLRAFDARYRAVVGARYAELDLLEAEIAEALSSLQPENEALREKARLARERANESAAALDERLPEGDEDTGFAPSDELRKLYRRVALAMHPDLCSNENEIQIRHELMVEANRAYTAGDADLLEALLDGTAAPIPGVSPEIAWARLRIARATQRAEDAEASIASLERSDLYRLWRSVEAASSEEHDALDDLAASLDRSIRRARNRHEVLTTAVTKTARTAADR